MKNADIEQLRSIKIHPAKNMCAYCCMAMLLKKFGIEHEDIRRKLPQYHDNFNVQDILLKYVLEENPEPKGCTDRPICNLTDAVNKLELGINVTREFRNSDHKRNGDFITIDQIEGYIDNGRLLCVNLYEIPNEIGHSYILHDYNRNQKLFYVINPTDKNERTLSYKDFERKWISLDVPYSELFFIEHK